MTLRKKLMLSLFIQPWNGTGKCVRFDLKCMWNAWSVAGTYLGIIFGIQSV